MEIVDKQCEFMKDGRKCKAWKITNSKYCFTHSDDPEIVVMREIAHRKASESRKLYLPLNPEEVKDVSLPKFVDLGKAKGIKKAYITIIKAASLGQIDERRLGALTYALNGYVSALDKIGLLERIEALERKDKERALD